MATLRWHNPTISQSEILVTLENTTSSVSTTGNCDAYTHFVELNYDQIANNEPQGKGPYLEALATLRGYSDDTSLIIGRVFNENVSILFKNSEQKVEIFHHSLDVILNHQHLLQNKCQNLTKSAFSYLLVLAEYT